MTILYFTVWTFSCSSQTELCSKKVNQKWCFVNTSGQIVLTTDYDYVCDFHYNLARVKKNDRWGYIDTTGKLVVPLYYDWAEDFQEGFGIVRLINKGCLKAPKSHLMQKIKCHEKFGIVDTSGHVTITKYDYITCFYNGYAKVFKTPWWKLRWNYNINWKKIDKNFVEYDIPDQ
jgi:hypothetical protein